MFASFGAAFSLVSPKLCGLGFLGQNPTSFLAGIPFVFLISVFFKPFILVVSEYRLTVVDRKKKTEAVDSIEFFLPAFLAVETIFPMSYSWIF